MNPKLQNLLVAIVLSLATPFLQARTVAWNNSPGDLIYQSNGTSYLDAGFSFEIGAFTFDAGFTAPTLANVGEWRSHWRTFDTAVLNTEWIPGSRFFTSSGSVQAGGVSSVTGATFTTGERGYLWIYNSTAINSQTEWGLFTSSSWTFPASAPTDPNDIYWTVNPPSNPPNFVFAANTAVIGGLNDVQASGSTGYTEPTTSYVLQTHLVQVPEPGSCLLVAIAGMIFQLRRRSKVGRR
jgi:hypothetical protein